LWKARGELKSSILDHAIVEGMSGTINKELDFRSRGRQGRGKFIKSQILDQSFKIKSWILDHGIVEGKGGKFK
jgi:formamidopyrimidine-DNA glycosylase